MDRPRRTARGVALLLAGTMALSGCGASMERVEQQRQLIRTGLSRDEVTAAIGRPDRTYDLDPEPGVRDQTVEVWSYTYEVGGDHGLALVVVGVAVIALVVVAVAAAKGGGGGSLGGIGGGGGGSWNEGATWRFCVGFGPDGRVRGISSLERIGR